MSVSKIALNRIQKQLIQIDKDPIPNVLVAKKGALNINFLIYGLMNQYTGGYYHGVLELDPEYPFKPPRLIFITPNGRFQIQKSICTTFTNFHKQAWTSSWTIRAMLLALVTFMQSDQKGLGHLQTSYAMKKAYALQSLKWNINNPQFQQLFSQQIEKLKLTINQQWANKKIKQDQWKQQQNMNRNNNNNNNNNNNIVNQNNRMTLLWFILLIILLLWIYTKIY